MVVIAFVCVDVATSCHAASSLKALSASTLLVDVTVITGITFAYILSVLLHIGWHYLQ